MPTSDSDRPHPLDGPRHTDGIDRAEQPDAACDAKSNEESRPAGTQQTARPTEPAPGVGISHSQESPTDASRRRRRRERRTRSPSSTKALAASLDMWTRVLLVVAVISSVLAIGTVHVRVLLAVGAVSIALGVIAFKAHHLTYGKWPFPAPSMLVLALTIWTALQAVPMPRWLLGVVAPHNADVWSRSLTAMGEQGPAWAPITMDPGATWVEVLKGIAYFAILTAAITVSKKRGAVFGIGLVFVSAVAAGGFTIIHGLAGLDKVFGLYEPKNNYSLWHIGPLLNTNHLCGYLNLGAMCGLGIVLMKEPPVRRLPIGLGVATLIGIAAASASRGGVLLIPVGLAAVVILLRSRPATTHEKEISGRTTTLVAFGAAGFGAALALLGLTTNQLSELWDKDFSKLNMLSWAAPLLRDHPLFGIGRGSFETVFPAYRETPGHIVFTHAENIVVQWTSEWGIVAAVVAAGTGVWLSTPGRLGATRSALAAGGWAGMLLVVLQNWVDFSLEIPSVAIAVACVFGSLWGDSGRRGIRTNAAGNANSLETSVWRKAWAPACLALAGILALGMVAKKGTHPASDERQAFYEASKSAPLSRETFRPMLAAAMIRHPAEPYFPMMGALRAWRFRDENPIPYIERTLERSRSYGRAHLLLAEILAAKGALSQSMLELRHSVLDEPSLASPAVEAAVLVTSNVDLLRQMVPEGPIGAEVLDLLGASFWGRDRLISAWFDREAMERAPERPHPHERMALNLIEDMQSNSTKNRCRGEEASRACLAELETHATKVEKAWPSESSRAARLRARAMLALNRNSEAWRILSLACDAATDRFECLQLQITVASRLRKTEDVSRLAKDLAGIGCPDSITCSKTHIWLGDFSLSQGNLGAAANAYERAAQEDALNDSLWMKVADVSVRLGAPVRAIHAWEQVAKRHPEDTELQERIRQEKLKTIGVLGMP